MRLQLIRTETHASARVICTARTIIGGTIWLAFKPTTGGARTSANVGTRGQRTRNARSACGHSRPAPAPPAAAALASRRCRSPARSFKTTAKSIVIVYHCHSLHFAQTHTLLFSLFVMNTFIKNTIFKKLLHLNLTTTKKWFRHYLVVPILELFALADH